MKLEEIVDVLNRSNKHCENYLTLFVVNYPILKIQRAYLLINRFRSKPSLMSSITHCSFKASPGKVIEVTQSTTRSDEVGCSRVSGMRQNGHVVFCWNTVALRSRSRRIVTRSIRNKPGFISHISQSSFKTSPSNAVEIPDNSAWPNEVGRSGGCGMRGGGYIIIRRRTVDSKMAHRANHIAVSTGGKGFQSDAAVFLKGHC